MFIEMWNKMFKQMRNMAKISKIAPLPPQPKQKERDGRTETGGRALRDGGGQGILKLNVQHLFNICLTFCWTFCLTFCSTFCSTFCWTFCWTFCSTFDPTFCLDAVNKKKPFLFLFFWARGMELGGWRRRRLFNISFVGAVWICQGTSTMLQLEHYQTYNRNLK